MSGYRLILFAAFALGIAGCSMAAPYRAIVSSPHKDVVRFVVFLEDRAPMEVYRRIALQEIDRMRALESEREFPLYEARFEFHRDGPRAEKLAQVTVYIQEPAAAPHIATAPTPRIETVLY
jgi:hypothetical protein